jgi:hypothetical protein
MFSHHLIFKILFKNTSLILYDKITHLALQQYKKVTAGISRHGRKFGSREKDLPAALSSLVRQIKEIG